jgi:hypothetical protein
VINCNFPFTRIRITKSSYDILQTLVNDLTLWQPKNSGVTDDFNYNERDSRFNLTGNYDIKSQPDSIYEINSYYSENSEMRAKLEESVMESRTDISVPSKPSLASVVIIMMNGT